MNVTIRLHDSIAAVCPIQGVSIGVIGVSATVQFQARSNATGAQLAAAQAVINVFDWSDAAGLAYENSKEPLLADLKAQAAAGIAAIDSYLLIADTATAAQVRTEVKAIDQRQKKIIQALNRLISMSWQ